MNAKSSVFDCLSQAFGAATSAGYVINTQGEALKITEAMIKQACAELKSRCHVPQKK